MGRGRGYGMLGFQPYFDIRRNWDGIIVSSTRRPLFTLKQIPRNSFLLEAELTPGLLNADRISKVNRFFISMLQYYVISSSSSSSSCSGRIRFDSCFLYPQNEIGPFISLIIVFRKGAHVQFKYITNQMQQFSSLLS